MLTLRDPFIDTSTVVTTMVTNSFSLDEITLVVTYNGTNKVLYYSGHDHRIRKVYGRHIESRFHFTSVLCDPSRLLDARTALLIGLQSTQYHMNFQTYFLVG